MLRVFYKSAFFKSLAHCQRHLEYLDKQGPLFDGKHEVSLHQAREAAEQFADAPKWWYRVQAVEFLKGNNRLLDLREVI